MQNGIEVPCTRREVRLPGWGHVIVTLALTHVIIAAGVINGVGHFVGYRNFACADASTNILPWASSSAATHDKLLRRPQDWCRRAEESGIRQLQDFSLRLRFCAV